MKYGLSKTHNGWGISAELDMPYKKCRKKFFHLKWKGRNTQRFYYGNKLSEKIVTLYQNRLLNNYSIKVKGEKKEQTTIATSIW